MQKAEGEANLNVQDNLNGDNDNGTNYPPPPSLPTHTCCACEIRVFFYSDHDLETDTLDIVLDRR